MKSFLLRATLVALPAFLPNPLEALDCHGGHEICDRTSNGGTYCYCDNKGTMMITAGVGQSGLTIKPFTDQDTLDFLAKLGTDKDRAIVTFPEGKPQIDLKDVPNTKLPGILNNIGADTSALKLPN